MHLPLYAQVALHLPRSKIPDVIWVQVKRYLDARKTIKNFVRAIIWKKRNTDLQLRIIPNQFEVWRKATDYHVIKIFQFIQRSDCIYINSLEFISINPKI